MGRHLRANQRRRYLRIRPISGSLLLSPGEPCRNRPMRVTRKTRIAVRVNEAAVAEVKDKTERPIHSPSELAMT
jgi:hypothetical protein